MIAKEQTLINIYFVKYQLMIYFIIVLF